MAKNILLTIAAILFTVFSLKAQTDQTGTRISGIINDSAENSALIGVSVLLTKTDDANQKYGTVTDLDGSFSFSNVVPGTYILRASFISYKTLEMRVRADQPTRNLGIIKLAPMSIDLKEVKVQGRQIRAQQKGDTTQYNADAFKVNPDANAQDLITKMPGVTVENGQVKAQGEEIKQVLVDGKPFFGEDPNVALKNLPAEIIDKVQVYDRMSDQSQFSGFNDGNTSKTINIITKAGRNNGQFGKMTAGYGMDADLKDSRYIVSGNLNLFKGNRRISILGLSNNINQQNFSIDDLVGAMGGGSGGPGGRGGMRGGGRPMRMPSPGSGGMSDFMVGTPGGITTTHALGLNFSDSIGRKIYMTGSYFFNMSNTNNESSLAREYFTGGESNPLYNETNQSESRNFNNRANLRLEYVIDTSNSLIYTPRISFQDNTMMSMLQGNNSLKTGLLLSGTINDYQSENFGYSFSNNLLFRHRFAKRGRTFSINLNGDVNNREGESKLQSVNTYYDFRKDSSIVLDQRSDFPNKSHTLSTNLSYTEPLGKLSSLQFSYNPSLTRSNSERETYNLDPATQQYTVLDTTLSNKFDNRSLTNRGGLSYQLNNQKGITFNAGMDYQHTLLEGQQLLPTELPTITKNFSNILPNARFNYKLSSSSNMRLVYRTNTNLPSVTQLQNVVNNSNPLLLTTGNPELEQAYSHMVFAHFNKTNMEKGRNFFVFLFASAAQDYISNSTTVALRDSLLPSGVVLYRGSQITRPVNLDGYRTARTFFTYGFPVDFMKSNLSFNGGLSFAHTPGLVNNVKNFSNNYSFSPGLTLSSNISQNLDFAISYNANYNIVENTIRRELNSNFFYQTSGVRFNWIFWKGFVFNTDLNHTLYTGLESGFNQNFLLWNMAIGKKFLKDNRGELRLSVFDLLKQNNSIGRNVTETYVEDTRTQVLQQYFMLTFTYNLRNFKGGAGAGQGGGDGRGGNQPQGNWPRPQGH